MEQQTDSDIENIEIEEGWKAGCSQLIPFKSHERYETAYKKSRKWLGEKNGAINEKSLLAYFVLRNAILKSASSLWAEYSMLRTTINLNDNIDISKFTQLIAFLKTKNTGHRPKKLKIFTKEQMNKFLKEAPNETYLMMKVVMIMGIAGACRHEELVKMTTDDVLDKGKVVIITIPNTKTHVPRTFTIIGQPNEELNFLEIFRKYFKLRPPNTFSKRFFYAYRNGKCINQVVGVNTMGKIPARIAQYLNLDNPASYTGHAFSEGLVPLSWQMLE